MFVYKVSLYVCVQNKFCMYTEYVCMCAEYVCMYVYRVRLYVSVQSKFACKCTE